MCRSPVRPRAATLTRRSRAHTRRSRRVSSLVGPACCPCRSPVRVGAGAHPCAPQAATLARRSKAHARRNRRVSSLVGPAYCCAARPCVPEPVFTCARLSRHARTLEQSAHPWEPSCARTPPPSPITAARPPRAHSSQPHACPWPPLAHSLAAATCARLGLPDLLRPPTRAAALTRACNALA
jgi:hypothetical protein